MTLGGIKKKFRLSQLVGLLLTGILLGPYALGIIAPEILVISYDLRQLALIVILLRAGLNLDVHTLQKRSSCNRFYL